MSTLKSDNSDLTINADGSGKSIKLQANGSEKVVIKSDGKVGIGTSSPNSLLELKSSAPIIRLTESSTSNYSEINAAYTSGSLQITADAGNVSSNSRIMLNVDGTERARFDSNGYLRLAGGGIQFNGDTAAANALDDYEEGTWTATITSTAATFTPNTTTAYYTKVGNLVTISYNMYMAGAPSGTFTNTVSIQGLPFTSAQAATITWGHHRWTEFPANTTDIGIQLDASSTQLRFYARTGISELTLLTGTVFKRNGSGIWLTGQYYV